MGQKRKQSEENSSEASKGSEDANKQQFKQSKNKKAKQEESSEVQVDKTVIAESSEAPRVVYPYEVDDSDHCESPIEAYQHIAIILQQLAAVLGKTTAELKIYDPFYCEGSVKERLGSLGFTNVYNQLEDFYAVQAAGKIPEYDVLLTNPPYSQDHMDKLVDFCVKSKKPWLLLVPNYVYMKDYYQNKVVRLGAACKCIDLSPTKRYLYTTPKGRRQEKSAKYTSPFPTFWYCGLYK